MLDFLIIACIGAAGFVQAPLAFIVLAAGLLAASPIAQLHQTARANPNVDASAILKRLSLETAAYAVLTASVSYASGWGVQRFFW